MSKKFLSAVLSASMVLSPMGGRSCFAQEDILTMTEENSTVRMRLDSCYEELGKCFVEKAAAKAELIKYIGIDGINEVYKLVNFTSNCDDKLKNCDLKRAFYETELKKYGNSKYKSFDSPVNIIIGCCAALGVYATIDFLLNCFNL